MASTQTPSSSCRPPLFHLRLGRRWGTTRTPSPDWPEKLGRPSRRISPSSSASGPSTSTGFPLLRFGAVVVGGLVKDLQHSGGETADGLGPRRQVRLFPAPFVQALQKFIGEPHLKRPILNSSRWAPHKCIDLYCKCHYIFNRPNGWFQHPPGPNPSQRNEL
jgi:hypothetical protein